MTAPKLLHFLRNYYFPLSPRPQVVIAERAGSASLGPTAWIPGAAGLRLLSRPAHAGCVTGLLIFESCVHLLTVVSQRSFERLREDVLGFCHYSFRDITFAIGKSILTVRCRVSVRHRDAAFAFALPLRFPYYRSRGHARFFSQVYFGRGLGSLLEGGEWYFGSWRTGGMLGVVSCVDGGMHWDVELMDGAFVLLCWG